MAKKHNGKKVKPYYEIQAYNDEGDEEIYLVRTDKDIVAFEACVELINKEGNFNGITLISRKNDDFKVIARFQGTHDE